MNFEIAPKSTEEYLSWNEAKMYCFALNIDGKTGWRLPTREELDEIYESDNDFAEYNYYWSATEYQKDNKYIWCKFFDEDDADNSYTLYTKDYDDYGGNFTRAVRDP